MTIDPVCKMTVDEKQATASVVYEGKTYHFCSEDCHKAFTLDPKKYLAPTGGGAAPRKH